MTLPKCIDCAKEGVTTRRKASGKPLLCATHRRSRRFNRRNYSWERHILETYGITPEEFWAMYDAQNGCCYICGRPRKREGKKLSIDHCHKTGRVRGLTDQYCNRFLGYIRDSPEAMLRGHDYLINPPAFAVIGERVVPNHDAEA